ncbi:MAG: chain-length determining protein [Bacteroidaceae bacterium]|nr:chain-length determining protein [Bacteroidaceae bacterium]
MTFSFSAYKSALRRSRRQIRNVLVASALVGLFVAFGTPRVYESGVVLAPETGSSGILGSGMLSKTLMMGLGKMAGSSEDAIYPDIYPDVVQSTDFIVSLFHVPLVGKEGAMDCDYYTYIAHRQKHAWWEYPLMPFGALMRMLTEGDDNLRPLATADSVRTNVICLTREEVGVAKAIGNNVDCTVDEKTGVIDIKVTDQDPVVAAVVADTIMRRLQEFITEYRTQKAVNDSRYLESLHEEARRDLAVARAAYAAFCDANQDIMLKEVETRQEELENEVELKQEIYSQLTEQLQMARAKVQEESPAFTIVQKAIVPVRHNNTPKAIVLVIWMMAGVVCQQLWMLARNARAIFKLEA